MTLKFLILSAKTIKHCHSIFTKFSNFTKKNRLFHKNSMSNADLSCFMIDRQQQNDSELDDILNSVLDMEGI